MPNHPSRTSFSLDLPNMRCVARVDPSTLTPDCDPALLRLRDTANADDLDFKGDPDLIRPVFGEREADTDPSGFPAAKASCH